MKKILVIGAGWEQQALIEEIKSQGHYIIATHPNMNTDGFQLADTFYIKSSRDIASHLEIAETHQIEAVISDNCDYSLYTAAIVASKFDLPYSSIKSALYSNDKYEQRKACSAGGIKQPEYRGLRTLDELSQAAEEIGYPLVVKPVDSRGTFGVTIVFEASELENAYYDSVDNSHSRLLICEKFIEGTLVTVDGFCFKNGHQSITVASRKFEQSSKPVTKEIVYPAEFSAEVNVQLLENHNKVVQSLGYHFGHTHGEYILTSHGEIYLVECTNRGTGVYTSSVINPLLTGINLNEIFLNQSLGIDKYETGDLGIEFMKKSVMLTFMDFQVNKVIKSMNNEELLALPYTVRYRTLFSEKDMVEPIANCAQRHSMLVIEGSTTQEMLNNFASFKNKLKIIYYQP